MKNILFFSKSSSYEHAVIKRGTNDLSFAEKILAELGPKNGLRFTFSKDGSRFSPDYLAAFDAFFFFTSGDLTAPGLDKNPPMTPAGKAALLEAVRGGKGFVGAHSASDTFLTGETAATDASDRSARYHNYGDKADPYVRMIGGEFIIHARQQNGKIRVVDGKFPGMAGLGPEFECFEEWYSLKEFAKDLHVLLVQETEGMIGEPYQRPPYPETWARMYGKGRVFFTSMGHREDVWTSARFQQILLGGLAWAVGSVEADVTPNLEKAAPRCAELPPPTPPAPANAGASSNAPPAKRQD